MSDILEQKPSSEQAFYDLFNSLIPFIIKLIRQSTNFSKVFLLENNDFMSYGFVVYKNYIEKLIVKKPTDLNFFLIDFGNELRDFFRKWYRYYNKNGHLVLNQYTEYNDGQKFMEPVVEIDSLYQTNYQLTKLYELLQKNILIRRFCFLKLRGKSISEICNSCKVSKHTFYKYMNLLKDAVIEN